MNYLLDTHTFIWAIMDKDKLSKRVKLALEDPDNNIWLSAISFWEISLKFSLGKLLLNGVVPDDFPSLATQTGFKLIPLISFKPLAITDLKENSTETRLTGC